MKRITLLIITVVCALAVAVQVAAGSGPAAHKSTLTEVGRLPGGTPAPACPGSGCRVLTRTSGYVGLVFNRKVYGEVARTLATQTAGV